MATLYDPRPVYRAKYKSDSRTEGRTVASFDAALYKPYEKGQQLKLTIYLRLKLQPITGKRLYPDSNGRAFWTTPWPATDWQRFVAAAKAQANMWNNRFWLQPPSTFSDFDQVFETFPNQAYRPNIRCELVVDFNPTEDAHGTVDVANLDLSVLVSPVLDGQTFRSNAVLWDSLDGVPWIMPLGSSGPARSFTMTHEIGHRLGLDHIGLLLKTPLCNLAVAAQAVGLDLTNQTTGGPDSHYCYGLNQPLSVSGNVMGFGANFTALNAMPWLWAIMSMRNNRPTETGWRVVLHDPGPASWVRL